MAVYGYARVSTAHQAHEGTSLAEQEKRIRGFAQSQGFELAKVFVDRDVSGGKPLAGRPQGENLLGTLKPGDVVIAYRMDRVFRSASDALASLERFRVQVVALHLIDIQGGVDLASPTGALTFGILCSVAQFERERLNERIREGKAAARSLGRYAGGPVPFGFRVNAQNMLERDPTKAPGRDLLLTLAAEGLSARAIHGRLSEAGYKVSLPTVSKVSKQGRQPAVIQENGVPELASV